MRIRNYSQKFQLPNGKYVYVQEGRYQANGRLLLEWCCRKWTPPKFYFHYRLGGHVAAVKVHLSSQFFARADLERFFWHVSRNKVVRALKRIGFKYSDAYEYAVNATVTDKGRHFLPFGFVESPFLATLCLDKSGLGTLFRDLIKKGIVVSVYVDDIILSADDPRLLDDALQQMKQVGDRVGFPLNTSKTMSVGPDVSAFNIEAGHGRMAVTDERMRQFITDINEAGNGHKSQAIIAYVSTVNASQSAALLSLLRTGP